jgi:hypothetical protein
LLRKVFLPKNVNRAWQEKDASLSFWGNQKTRRRQRCVGKRKRF